jgi:hypothetical protein
MSTGTRACGARTHTHTSLFREQACMIHSLAAHVGTDPLDKRSLGGQLIDQLECQSSIATS